MKEHWQEKHPAELARMREWLRESTAKVQSYEAVAQEGMQGYGKNDVGVTGQKQGVRR